MGARAYFEEGFSGKSLTGSYFNGVFEKEPIRYPKFFPGNPTHTTSIANSTDWLFCRISAGGEILDLGKSTIRTFRRVLDFKTGLLRRSFVWETTKGAELDVCFERLLSMRHPQVGLQRVAFRCLKGDGDLVVRTGLMGGAIQQTAGYSFWRTTAKEATRNTAMLMGRTKHSGLGLCSVSRLQITGNVSVKVTSSEEQNFAGQELRTRIGEGETMAFERIVSHSVDRRGNLSDAELECEARSKLIHGESRSFDQWVKINETFWAEVWENSDVEIEGDDEAQQGIRFCIFQCYQTYMGFDPDLNIGAKGLTGEVYWGGAWWDTETYCLPFYLFNNPRAARNLLLWRHRILPGARQRAVDHGCRGARYPMCTIDGSETCVEWQHGDIEIHVSAAVAYGIFHYWLNTRDDDFLYGEGIEMLLEISRFYISRGSTSPLTNEFGYWGVMGADEFHMMVHNNAYTNIMAKKAIQFTLETIEKLRAAHPDRWESLAQTFSLEAGEWADWAQKAARTRTNFDEKSGLFEQHDGFFDLPHIDLSTLSADEFPLYAHWPYINLFRYDMIKQPDVLLLMFLFSSDYDPRVKAANFDYYEPRCSHESSLSPGIHAILAAELGREDEASRYFQHATRLDLDNYNRNTHEGLHLTSMAGAWLNIVYGWGGFRSDEEVPRFAPRIPGNWKSYRFRLYHHNSWIEVHVDRQGAQMRVLSGLSQLINVSGEDLLIGETPVRVTLAKNQTKDPVIRRGPGSGSGSPP